MKKVFVDGQFVDAADAKISIFDRGFLFGDAVYEVLPVYRGKPMFVDRHINRLNSNLIKLKIGIPEIDWNKLIDRLITENHGDDLQIYIHVTRGNQGMRKHDIPSSITPSVIAFTLHHPYPLEHEKEAGITAKVIEDIRWMRCDIKSTSLLGNVLLNDEAVSSGFDTSILIRNNFLTEGSAANVFIVSPENIIKTPPLTQYCLPGITRELTIELILDLNLPFSEIEVEKNELYNAKEVWITSTTKEIMPVTRIDDTLINKGKAGDLWRILDKSYRQLIP